MTAQTEARTPQLLRAPEAAAYIGVSLRKVRQLIASGELDSVLLSTRCRVIPRTACDAYVTRVTEQAAARSA